MALINHSIPNLFNGVSQQPASLRATSQCELQENAYATVAAGLRKRPPAAHSAKVVPPAGFGSDYVPHTITRENARHEVLVKNGGLAVIDLATGESKTVSAPNGFGYLNCTDLETAFTLVTVADYTFIINKEKKVAMSATESPLNPVNIAYVVVVNAPHSHTFTITVDGIAASYSLSSTGGTQTDVANGLASNLGTALGAGYEVVATFSHVVKITKKSGASMTVVPSDSYGNQALVAVSNGVPRFSSLPSMFAHDYTVTVHGDPGNSSDTYYVRYTGDKWIETTKPGSKNSLDASTMPHRLIPQADGTWLFAPCEWNDRQVGDDDSNPVPSFVGRTINDLFFFRNRLGLLSDENVIMSVSNKFFDFYAASVRAVLDSDPIDVSTPGTAISILRHAVPFNKVLLLFSDKTQFQLSAGDILSPKTVRIDVATSFESSSLARPVAVGQELFFALARGKYTAIREYYVDNDTVSNDAVEITAHVPHYIPGNVFQLAASSNEDVIACLSRDERNALYVYKFYWAKNEKVQSCWSKFVFGATDKIHRAHFIANKLHLLIEHSDGLYEEVIDLQSELEDEGMGYVVNLDRKVFLTGVYDAAADTTTWTLPYSESGDLVTVLGSTFSGQTGAVIKTSRPSSSTVQATGDYSSGGVYIGKPYTLRYRFSEQYVHDANNIAILAAILKLRRLSVIYSSTGNFTVEVTPKFRDTYTYKFTGKRLGFASMLVGSSNLESGVFTVPIQTSNLGVTIDILNDSHLPSTFQSAEWEGEMIIKSQRR